MENNIPIQLIGVGLLILAAHLGGSLFRRMGLSEITGQLLGGILVGPYVLGLLNVIPEPQFMLLKQAFNSFHFFVFLFLTLVAFSIGEELFFKRLKKVGKVALVVSLFQFGITWILIFGLFALFTELALIKTMIIASIGVATAPAITFILMNKLNVQGRIRQLIGSIVIIDDVIAVIVFSSLLQIALQQQAKGQLSYGKIFASVSFELFLAIIIGIVIYFFLHLMIGREVHDFNEETLLRKKFEKSNMAMGPRIGLPPSPSVEIFLLVIGAVALGCGLSYYFHLPFIITAVVAGVFVSNFHSHAIFSSLKLEHITSIMGLLFFALIGANISLDKISHNTLLMVVFYIVARAIGKIGGTWLGCVVMKEEPRIKRILPFLSLHQAGVAAVESVYAGLVLNLSLIHI